MAGNTDADRLSGKWAKREGATKNQMARAGFKQSCGGERLKIASKVREKAYSSQLGLILWRCAAFQSCYSCRVDQPRSRAVRSSHWYGEPMSSHMLAFLTFAVLLAAPAA